MPLKKIPRKNLPSRHRPDDHGDVILYRTEDGRTALDVRLAGETVWLTQAQIAELFTVNTPAISKHINNIYTARELTRKATASKIETVQTEGKRQVARRVDIYNLDMIIAVGYRVNSARATRFRIWATQTLKDHLIRGYTLNERRLREKGLSEAEQTVQLLSRTLTRHKLVNDEGRGVLDVVSRYAKSWLLLKAYDEAGLTVPERRKPARIALDYPRARAAIDALKARLLEHGEQFPALLGSIEQTFDGNKRIGSFLFILYLRENNHLEDTTGQIKINDNAPVTLALLTAESEPPNKELMIRLVMNLVVEGGASTSKPF